MCVCLSDLYNTIACSDSFDGAHNTSCVNVQVNEHLRSKQTQTSHHSIDLNDPGSWTEDEKVKLAFNLGILERANVHNFAADISQKYKNVSYMNTFDIKSYVLESHNIILNSFLNGLCPDLSQYKQMRSIETIVNCCVSNILPLHFRETLILYTMTKSKDALEMLCGESAYCSYSTIMKRWLELLSKNDRQDIEKPMGNLIIANDNNQIIKKKWSIRLDNKCASSTVCMVVGFSSNKCDTTQCQDVLKPGNWRNNVLSADNLSKLKYYDQDDYVKSLHYDESLYPLLCTRIAKVVAEQEFVNDTFQDKVDKKVDDNKLKAQYKVCIACKYQNGKTCRKCGKCGNSLLQSKPPIEDMKCTTRTTHETRIHVLDEGCSLKYVPEHVSDIRPAVNERVIPEVYVMQPIIVNPNSYDSIRTVLLGIGHEAGIMKYGSGTRSFVLLYCDGVPYSLIQRICRCTYRCSVCQEVLTTLLSCEEHLMDVHLILNLTGSCLCPGRRSHGDEHVEVSCRYIVADMLEANGYPF